MNSLATSRTLLIPECNDERIQISVCICTYRRPQLKDCLESVSEQRLGDKYAVRIVVVDNCPDKSATDIVNRFKQTNNLDIAYLSCPIKNLSNVRNEALNAATGHYVALVDDDEIVSKNWLESLISCSTQYDADIVIGPVYNQYSETCPDWLAKSDLMARAAPPTGKLMQTGHAGNALIKTSALDKISLRFDERLGRSGGEDTDFFFRLHQAGAKIVACREASACEVIDPVRENMNYLIQENKRIGQVFCRVFWPSWTPLQRTYALVKVLGKTTLFSLGYLLSLPFGKRFSAYWKLRCTCNLEKLRYLYSRNQTIFRYCV